MVRWKNDNTSKAMINKNVLILLLYIFILTIFNLFLTDIYSNPNLTNNLLLYLSNINELSEL